MQKVAKTFTSNVPRGFISIMPGEHFTALENILPWLPTIWGIKKLNGRNDAYFLTAE